MKTIWLTGVFYDIMTALLHKSDEAEIGAFASTDIITKRKLLMAAVCTFVRSPYFNIASIDWVSRSDEAYKNNHSALKTFNAFESYTADAAIRHRVLSFMYHTAPEGQRLPFLNVLPEGGGVNSCHYEGISACYTAPATGDP